LVLVKNSRTRNGKQNGEGGLQGKGNHGGEGKLLEKMKPTLNFIGKGGAKKKRRWKESETSRGRGTGGLKTATNSPFIVEKISQERNGEKSLDCNDGMRQRGQCPFWGGVNDRRRARRAVGSKGNGGSSMYKVPSIRSWVGGGKKECGG